MDSEEPKIEDPPPEVKAENNPQDLPPSEEVKAEENPSEPLPTTEEHPPEEAPAADPSALPDDPSPEKLPETKAESAKDAENHSEANPVSIHITLQDLKDPSKKSMLNLDIADNLFYKDALEKSKFDAFKLKFKANEASEMREAPQISKKTKNILQKKKITLEQKQKKQAAVNYDNFDHNIINRVHDHRRSELLRLQKVDYLNTAVMKDSMKAREDFGRVKEKADQKANELITKCKIAEIQSTTKETKDKDTKTLKDKKNSKSASMVTLQSVMVAPEVLNSRVPPPNKSKHVKTAVNLPLDSVLISKNYSQLTPISASFRYNSGYNQEDLLSKSRPMVDYRMPLSPTAS